MILPGECLCVRAGLVQSVSLYQHTLDSRSGLRAYLLTSPRLRAALVPAGSRGLCLPSLSLQPPGTGAAAGRVLT